MGLGDEGARSDMGLLLPKNMSVLLTYFRGAGNFCQAFRTISNEKTSDSDNYSNFCWICHIAPIDLRSKPRRLEFGRPNIEAF
jgi:hypothetical protein